ncbi:MAG: YdiU family protein [Nitrospiria bacterium]
MHPQKKKAPLDTLPFDNRFVRALPADPEIENRRRQVLGACYSRVRPTKVARPELVAYSRDMAETLGLNGEDCETADFAAVFSGNRLAAGMDPYATCYGGHQFGSWAGQLGDGRAINLGEVVNGKGERWALQLKGAGPTPYSRSADGFAVLRSSIREFLCSEAMFHLGVPTTRALSLVTTGEQILRDMFYDGHPQMEPGAIVCRVAPSFTRFGHFQIFASRGEVDVMRQLIDYTIRTDFPHLGEPSKETILPWFQEICRRTAEMIVHWMRVGFVHGVMNSDNMSILGLTIDYGPYGWLEDFDPNWTPNTTDAQGRRYRFSHQPQIAQWNLYQLANALYPVIGRTEPLEAALNEYSHYYEDAWEAMMAQKLGLLRFKSETDKTLMTDLLTTLQLLETDMILFYRNLAKIDVNGDPLHRIPDDVLISPLKEAYYQHEQLADENKARIADWVRQYIERLRQDGLDHGERRRRMNAVNPKYVLRNYLAQLAIDQSEQGDHALVNELLDLLRRPYDEQPEKEAFAAKRPDWARTRAGCSMLSCSS